MRSVPNNHCEISYTDCVVTLISFCVQQNAGMYVAVLYFTQSDSYYSLSVFIVLHDEYRAETASE